MTTLSLRLPDSLHEHVKRLAKQDGISINQFIAAAVGEKMAALCTESYLQQRARQGDDAAFLSVMNKVPDVEPDERDRVLMTHKPL